MDNEHFLWPIIEEEVVGTPAQEMEITGEIAALLMPEENIGMTSIFQDEVQSDQVSLMVELPNCGWSLVCIEQKEVLDELSSIVSSIAGHSKHLEMEKTGVCLVDKYLLPALPKSLRDLQKNEKTSIEETLKILGEVDSIKSDTLEGNVHASFFLLCLRLKNTTDFIFPHERLLKESLWNIYLLSKQLGKNETSPLLSSLLSSLREYLRELKDKSRSTFTLAEVKNEASKLMYVHMRKELKKVATHPEHIANIPRYWDDEHMEEDTDSLGYPSPKICKSISDYTGLSKHQVDDLFCNYRNRGIDKGKKVQDALQKKQRFTKEVTDVFRKWKADNLLRNIPDKTDMASLVKDSGKDEKQISDWFHNHAPGREERNKSKKRARPK